MKPAFLASTGMGKDRGGLYAVGSRTAPDLCCAVAGYFAVRPAGTGLRKPVARIEYMSRPVGPTYGVTVMPSNSTGANGAEDSGTGCTRALTFTVVSRARPARSGSMSVTRTIHTRSPVTLSTAGVRTLVASL